MGSIVVGSMERSYLLHLPPGDLEGLPLIIALHPLGSNPKLMEAMTSLSEAADRHRFIVAYPQGFRPEGGRSSWNALFCCKGARDANVDDIGFLSRLIDLMREEYGIKGTMVAGMSNGGMLAHIAAIKLAEKIDAMAAVAATIGPGLLEMTPPRPVPTLIIHGTSDEVIPYDATRYDFLLPARESAQYWVKKNACDPNPVANETAGVVTERYLGGRDDSEVLVCLVKEAGHVWPGSRVRAPSELDPRTVDATEMMVDFFLSRMGLRARSRSPSSASSAAAGAPSWSAGPQGSRR